MAVEEVAALAELVEVVFVKALKEEDMIKCTRLAELELDNGLLLVLVLLLVLLLMLEVFI